MRRPGAANMLSLSSSPGADSSSPASISWSESPFGVLVLRLLAAHLGVTAAGSLVLALLGGVVASAVVAFGIVAGFVGLFVERLLGSSEVEILEQPPRQLRESRLVVERQRERVELGRRFLLDPRRDQLRDPRRPLPEALRRSAARAR